MKKYGWRGQIGFPIHPQEIRAHWICDLRDGTNSVWIWLAPEKKWCQPDNYFSYMFPSEMSDLFLYLGEAKRKNHPIGAAGAKNVSDLYIAPDLSFAPKNQMEDSADPEGEMKGAIDCDKGDSAMTDRVPVKAEVDDLKAKVLALRNGAVASSEALGYFMEERDKMAIRADEVTMERDRLLQIIRHMEPNEEVDDLAKMIAQALARAEGCDPWANVTSGDGVKHEWQRFLAEAREIANAAVERSSQQTFS